MLPSRAPDNEAAHTGPRRMCAQVLVVEDDPITAAFIKDGLTEAAYSVELAADGVAGLQRARSGDHDCIVLDRLLPQMDGIRLLETLRGENLAIPVIILSAIGSTDERVRGLRAGSDDYLVKPFSIAELLARIDAIIRRSGGQEQEQTKLTCQDMTLNLLTRQIERAGQTIALPPRACRLLEFFLRHQGQIVTRRMILEKIWNYDFDPGTNVVEVQVSHLRKAIDLDGMRPLLRTVRGQGYRLGDPI